VTVTTVPEIRRRSFLLALGALARAQQPQNPSPMVEHARAHQRLKEETPLGRPEPLEIGTLFVPESLAHKRAAPLLIFFHGGKWLPEVAAARNRMAAISIQIGAGSGVYVRAFTDQQRLQNLLREAEQKAGMKLAPLTLGGWSAGCGAIREILKSPEAYARADRVLAIDGIHTDYAEGKPGPLESKLGTENLENWVRLARDAMAGAKRFLITHSEIFPGTFASTTETADYILAQLNLKRRPVVRWGPMHTQVLSEARVGRFLLLGFAGNTAPDHVDQLHSLPEYLKWK
jgi:hypothetical protein